VKLPRRGRGAKRAPPAPFVSSRDLGRQPQYFRVSIYSTVSTTAPLTDYDRSLFLRAVRERDDVDARTAWFIWSTGAWPWCLAHPNRARFTLSPGYIDYRAAKRQRLIRELHIPLNPEIASWAPAFLEMELGYSEREYNLRVVAFGKSCGLDGLSPRTCRHDYCLRACITCGWDLNRAGMLTGTSPTVLLRYANRRDQGDLDRALLFG
jgi:hypothetical protein